MKQRVKTDVFLLISVIVVTGIFYVSPPFFSRNNLLEIILDFVGFVTILKGVSWRVMARGHKKANSHRSESLVTTGIYTISRNPMYLGTLMIGLGFTLILWPWWAVPLFAIVFYQRFKHEMAKEENFLTQKFGVVYQNYCAQTPRLFPSFTKALSLRVRDIVNLKEAFSTKESWGLLSWPALAFLLACLQQQVAMGYVDLLRMGLVLWTAVFTFVVGFILKYWFK